MTIRSIETFHRNPVAFCRVTSDDGAQGWGQLSPYNADIAAEVLHRQVAPLCLGRDEGDIDGLVEAVMEGTYKFPGSYVCRALCGVETALWDLRGRRQGRSVADLLGRRRDRVLAYGSSMRRDIKPDDECERFQRLVGEKGFKAFKMRVGSVCGRDQDQWPGRTPELIAKTRKAVGDSVNLMADGNSCYSAAAAIEVGRMMQDQHFYWFEEPCLWWQYDATRQVADALEMPVSGGEQDNFMPAWDWMIDSHTVDIVQPDVCYIGGLTRTLHVARRAAGKGLRCVPHSANLSMVTVFTLHLMAAIENAEQYLEFSIEPNEWVRGLFDPALEVVDGALKVPDEPGWGVTIRADWLEKAERRISEAT